jgi:hypothetical protein
MGLQDAIVSTLKGGPGSWAEEPPEVDELTLASIAEDAVLAGCCRNADYAKDALSRLIPADFDMEWRRVVFNAMLSCREAGDQITTATLYPLLGWRLWDRLARANADARNPHEQDYVRMVKGYWRMRNATAAMLARITLAEALP